MEGDGLLERSLIDRVRAILQPSHELEVRLHLFTNYEPAIRGAFSRLLRAELPADEITTSHYRVDIDSTSNIRRISDLTAPKSTTSVRWQLKTRVHNEDIDSLALRVSISDESVPRRTERQILSVDITREIWRYSYQVNKNTRLDLSDVLTLNNDGTTTTNFEFEAEFIPNEGTDNGGLSTFNRGLREVFLLLHDTVLVYTRAQYNARFVAFNSAISAGQANFMRSDALYRARDLKYGDLIGRAWLHDRIRVTYKTDGYRRAMIIDRDGIWLAYLNSLNYVSRREPADKSPAGLVTILDGELVPPNKRTDNGPRNRLYYVIFDGLVVGGRDIRALPQRERIDALEAAANLAPLLDQRGPYQIMRTEVKQFYDFYHAADFFALMRRLEKENKSSVLPYYEDGYIFVSNLMPYNSGVDKCPPEQRILTRRPDMCKWKPESKLTIDFEVQITAEDVTNSTVYLDYLVATKAPSGGGRTLFEHAPHAVLSSNQLNDDVTPLTSGAVYECIYDKQGGFFIPVRQRYDRTAPNGLEEALFIWRSIEDPISIDVLIGRSLTLMRKYHSREKRMLYRQIPALGSKQLLDIGAGHGGTVDSWKLFDHVIAVEPNEENIAELIRRLDAAAVKWQLLTPQADFESVMNMVAGDDSKVIVIATGGEDSDLISRVADRFFPDGKADVIASMFSLTFFWQSDALLDRLKVTFERCLKLGGQFIFTVMDGTAVRNVFAPQLNGRAGIAGNVIKTKNYKITYTGPYKGEPLYVFLKDTIVGEKTTPQEEYLAYPEELLQYFDTFKLVSL